MPARPRGGRGGGGGGGGGRGGVGGWGGVGGVDAGSPEGAAGLAEAGVQVQLDADGVELVESARCLVKSPGVPQEAPAVARALVGGIPVIGELELAWRLLPNRFVAVTGTN